MSATPELIELYRQRQREAKTPQRKSWWSHEANMLACDPSREAMVRRFLAFDPRLASLPPLPTTEETR